jgi:hypothetical protein
MAIAPLVAAEIGDRQNNDGIMAELACESSFTSSWVVVNHSRSRHKAGKSTEKINLHLCPLFLINT